MSTTSGAVPTSEYGGGLVAADERLHGHDPDDWSWNESWFFSWIDLDGGPAGVFRVGVLPNQRRAILWCFVHVDGAWLTIEETRLPLDDLDFARDVAYDQFGLRFDWHHEEPFSRARFTAGGMALVRSGANAGARVHLDIDLDCFATAAVVGSGVGDEDKARSEYPTARFEQSFGATGTVTVDGTRHSVRAGGQRDKCWGPRDWRHGFAMGDIQFEDRQVYFVGYSFPGLSTGYLREGSNAVVHLECVDGRIDYDDANRTIRSAYIGFETPAGERLDLDMEPISPGIVFDVAHTLQEPEAWLYWRLLVDARVRGWDSRARGWFEAGRYGVA